MKVIIDSSVFISALGKNDIYSEKSRICLKQVNSSNIVLPSIIAAEVINILRRQKYKFIQKIAEHLLSFPMIDLDDAFIRRFIEEFNKLPDLKTADTIIILSAYISNALLVTWDKQLLKIQSKYCSIYSPDEYIKSGKKLMIQS